MIKNNQANKKSVPLMSYKDSQKKVNDGKFGG